MLGATKGVRALQQHLHPTEHHTIPDSHLRGILYRKSCMYTYRHIYINNKKNAYNSKMMIIPTAALQHYETHGSKNNSLLSCSQFSTQRRSLQDTV